MELYTFIMEYLGGTYISQVKAKDEFNAMQIWLKALKVKEIKGFTKYQYQKLLKEDFEDEKPILIEGCKNVWCFGLRISNKENTALINFIKTK